MIKLSNREKWIVFTALLYTGSIADLISTYVNSSTGLFKEGNMFGTPLTTLLLPPICLALFWINSKINSWISNKTQRDPRITKYGNLAVYWIMIIVLWIPAIHNIAQLLGVLGI
jgi:hypothetical protein